MTCARVRARRPRWGRTQNPRSDLDRKAGWWPDAARFYAAEAAKVIQAYLHAAALTGRTLDHLLRWVASPSAAVEPVEIHRERPHAAPFWHGLLHAPARRLHGACTATTGPPAAPRPRCSREDPYASASPLMTAVAEHVLDTAFGLAHGRCRSVPKSVAPAWPPGLGPEGDCRSDGEVCPLVRGHLTKYPQRDSNPRCRLERAVS